MAIFRRVYHAATPLADGAVLVTGGAGGTFEQYYTTLSSAELYRPVVLPSNNAPTISGTPISAVSAGTSYSFTLSASDADGHLLTYSITNKPGWASFDGSTGALTGTPVVPGIFSDIRITVRDGKGWTAQL